MVVPDWTKRIFHMRAQAQCLLLSALTYGPGRVSLKRILRMHFYLICVNNNHIGILDVLLNETIISKNGETLPATDSSKIRENLAKSMPGQI